MAVSGHKHYFRTAEGYPMGSDIDEIRTEIDQEVGSVPWVSATIIGISYLFVAFVAVPILMVLDILLISPEGSILPDFGSSRGFIHALVWSFYNAHAVPITGNVGNLNLIDLLDGGLPTAAYYLVPAIASFMGGRSIARSNAHSDMSNEALGALGALMVVGYGGLMFLGIFLSEWRGVAPATGEGILFAALGFPLVFGFLGGYLADR